MIFTRTLTIIGVSCIGSATALSSDFRVGQIVQTTSGAVQGHCASGISDISEYLGIPFVGQVILISLKERANCLAQGKPSYRTAAMGATSTFQWNFNY